MKHIIKILRIFIVLIISNCSNINKKDFNIDHTAIQSKKIPEIYAYVNYYGIVPCDGCIAIETEIYLTNFKTFVQKERFLYKDYQTSKLTHGTFSFDRDDRSLINLSNGITYKIHDKNNLQKFKNYGKINKSPTIKQKQDAKSIHNVDIDFYLIKR